MWLRVFASFWLKLFPLCFAGCSYTLWKGGQERDRCVHYPQKQDFFQAYDPTRFRQGAQGSLLKGANLVLHTGQHRTQFSGKAKSDRLVFLRIRWKLKKSLFSRYGTCHMWRSSVAFIFLHSTGHWSAQKESRNCRQHTERCRHLFVRRPFLFVASFLWKHWHNCFN